VPEEQVAHVDALLWLAADRALSVLALPEAHHVQDVEPAEFAYLPASQMEHAEEPDTDVYEPVAQFVQLLTAPVAYLPLLHAWQSEAASCPDAAAEEMYLRGRTKGGLSGVERSWGRAEMRGGKWVTHFPFGHEVQAVCAVDAWYLPFPHTLHDDCPVDAWYVPAPHAAQDDCPVEDWYLPVAQLEHPLAPAALYLPVLHVAQSLTLSCRPALDAESAMYLPAGQLEHELEPALLYLPVPQME
jgi:hypothetical protein